MRKFISAYILILLMVPWAFCETKDATRAGARYGGTLIWGTRNKPAIINPILTTHSISASLLDLIFSRLVRMGSRGEIGPDLAESWDISSDGLVYTFHLRKGARFHDGVECTAEDVKFTFDRILDPLVNSPFRLSFQLVKDFKVVDKYTFSITLNKPSFSFIYRLLREIAPKHLLEKVDLRNSSFNFYPIGSGPFRFKEWTKDNQIILEYNPDYYEERPYLDKIIVKAYPDSRDLWAAFMRGEVDYVEFMEKEDYEVVKLDQSFKPYTIAFDYYYALAYNLNDSILINKRIREAIAYGIDRKSLINRVAGGYGLECNGPFHPESLGFNPLVKPFEYNPQQAQALLAEAGWQDKDNDGILENEGEELEIRVLVDARSDIYRRIVMAIRQQLQEIGIKIKVVFYNDEKMLIDEEFLKQTNPQAQLKLFWAGINPGLAKEYWCSKKFKEIDKLWIYKNEEVDRLFELGEVAQDKRERQQIYQKTYQLIYENQPICFLYFPFDFFAVSSKLTNTDDFFTINMPYYKIKDWYLRRAERR